LHEKSDDQARNHSFLHMSGTESSKTAHNISVEEKLAKFHSEIGPYEKIGELAKRVFLRG